jgi:hypothetical protein
MKNLTYIAVVVAVIVRDNQRFECMNVLLREKLNRLFRAPRAAINDYGPSPTQEDDIRCSLPNIEKPTFTS